MGVGCCMKFDSKNNNMLTIQKIQKENSLKELILYYKSNKSFMNQKVRVIFKQICKSGKYYPDTLNLNFVSFSKMRTEYLLHLLPYLENLKVLKLWKAGLGSEGMKIVARDLGIISNLETLSLEENFIGPNGCMYLASSLEKLHKLRNLWLHINDIGPIGICCICDVISNMPLLEKIGLDENSIENKGAVKIMNALKGLKNIKILGLGYNAISEEVALSLVRNLSGIKFEKIILAGNGISEGTLKLMKILLPETIIVV
ncbi:hypothetical protein SteCoe_6511 [Stentor coeruleus]|uniref:Uncharacterized protein n=1 Tax=Stentor coeruleus TaxID=5963 RepID=A0A1R2CPW5_9CILI|nr:hypothetical protein SteCoe_6511 [Stentor coeruleus]